MENIEQIAQLEPTKKEWVAPEMIKLSINVKTSEFDIDFFRLS